MNDNISDKEIIYSGLMDWDEAIGGFVPGQLIIIAGRPAMGKTAFAVTLFEKLAIIRDVPVAFFSLEMSTPQIILKLLTNVFNCTPDYFREGQQCEVDEHAILAHRVLKDTPLYIDDTPALSLDSLESKITELKSEGIKVVIVDYMQLLDDFLKDVEVALATLKRIAEEHKITLIALSQVRRDDTQILPDGALDVASSFRHFDESYVRYADTVSVIHRPAYYSHEIWSSRYSNVAEIHFIKNNHCDVECIKLKFDGASSKFSNMN